MTQNVHKPQGGASPQNDAQLSAVLNARLVLCSAPPAVSLTFAVKAMQLPSGLKAADGAPPLPAIVAAIRDSASEMLGTLVKIPAAELAPPEEWDKQAAWFCDAVSRFAPEAPASASAFAEQILATLAGEMVRDPALSRVQKETSERVKAIARHMLDTFDTSFRRRIAESAELRKNYGASVGVK